MVDQIVLKDSIKIKAAHFYEMEKIHDFHDG